jgi:hypothetical protein
MGFVERAGWQAVADGRVGGLQASAWPAVTRVRLRESVGEASCFQREHLLSAS